MEPLFTADLIVDGANKLYNVSFRDESYFFEPEDGAGRSFHIKRAGDEWQVASALASPAQQQAIAALDRYLLAQH